MKDFYDRIKIFLEVSNYTNHDCQITAEIKIIRMLTEVQYRFTKYWCFLRESGSRGKKQHDEVRDWPVGVIRVPRVNRVELPPLPDISKVKLSPLHMKLELKAR